MYSPADAFSRKLVTNPRKGVRPACFAEMPREKETARYPSPMGMPSRKPSRNAFVFVFIKILL
jgi:hypothetical protein